MCDHLSGRCVAAPLGAAYPGLTQSPCERVRMKTSRLPPSADGFVPAWPCSRRGLPVHLHYCKCRWSLTPPFHHHRLTSCEVNGCLFLWPLSGRFAPCGGSPPRGLSDAVLYGVRTFLDPDNAGPRSPNRPEASFIIHASKASVNGVMEGTSHLQDEGMQLTRSRQRVENT